MADSKADSKAGDKAKPKRTGKTPQQCVREVQDRFLEAYRRFGVILYACQETGIGRHNHYEWMSVYPEYAERFQQAKEDVADVLEKEAIRRAYAGVEEPVYWKGERCGTIRKYSDTLLIFLLKGLRPERYRERYELSGQGGGPVTFRVVYEEPEPSSPQTRSIDDWPRYPFTIKCRPSWMDRLNEIDSGAGEERQAGGQAEGQDVSKPEGVD